MNMTMMIKVCNLLPDPNNKHHLSLSH